MTATSILAPTYSLWRVPALWRLRVVYETFDCEYLPHSWTYAGLYFLSALIFPKFEQPQLEYLFSITWSWDAAQKQIIWLYNKSKYWIQGKASWPFHKVKLPIDHRKPVAMLVGHGEEESSKKICCKIRKDKEGIFQPKGWLHTLVTHYPSNPRHSQASARVHTLKTLQMRRQRMRGRVSGYSQGSIKDKEISHHCREAGEETRRFTCKTLTFPAMAFEKLSKRTSKWDNVQVVRTWCYYGIEGRGSLSSTGGEEGEGATSFLCYLLSC